MLSKYINRYPQASTLYIDNKNDESALPVDVWLWYL